MAKLISFKISDKELEMLEIYKECDYRKNNPDAFRSLLAKGYGRIKKEKRQECKQALFAKGILPIKKGVIVDA